MRSRRRGSKYKGRQNLKGKGKIRIESEHRNVDSVSLNFVLKFLSELNAILPGRI